MGRRSTSAVRSELRWSEVRVRARLLLLVGAAVLLTLPRLEARPATADLSEVGPRQSFGPGLTFVENRGQWDSGIRFASCFGRAVVRPEQGAVSLGVLDPDGERGHVLRVAFDALTEPRGLEPIGDVFHFLVGDDAARWNRYVPGYRGIAFDGVSPGIDLVVEGAGAHARWTLTSTTSASPLDAGLRIEGQGTLESRPDGSLLIRTSAGTIEWSPPRFRDEGAASTARIGRWVVEAQQVRARTMDGEGDLPFESVEWATYFGGNSGEFYEGVDTCEDGSVVAGGFTYSNVIPTTPGAFQVTQSSPGSETGFVTRFAGDGASLIFATFLGGSVRDEVLALRVMVGGDVLVAGATESPDFPSTAGAFDEEKDPITQDGFVARLTADGSDLTFSSFFGGNVPAGEPAGSGGTDVVTAVGIDSEGHILLGGCSSDPYLPVSEGAYQPSLNRGEQSMDGFVARLSADGTKLLACTYLGGGAVPGGVVAQEDLRALAVLPDDSIVVVGNTVSQLFPTTPDALAPTHHGESHHEGFVARLSADLSTLVFGTYLGGTGREFPRDVAIHPDGSILVVGEVESKATFSIEYDFPITDDAFDAEPGGIADGFLVRIDPLGKELLYSTFFGGTGREELPMALAVDSAGAVTVACKTFSFFEAPVTPGALQTEKSTGNNDPTGLVVRFHPDGRRLLYGTYLGGSEAEISSAVEGIGLALTPLGDAVVAQTTWSGDFPLTEGSAFPDLSGINDGFVAALTMLPEGVTRYGTATAGPAGPLAIGVLAMPSLGNHSFGLTCTNAPPNSVGYLFLSEAPLATSMTVAGASTWVDPSRLLLLGRVRSNSLGFSQSRLAVPEDPALEGARVYAQYLWPVSSSAAGSAALRLEIQP